MGVKIREKVPTNSPTLKKRKPFQGIINNIGVIRRREEVVAEISELTGMT